MYITDKEATTITAIIGIPCGIGVIAFGIYFKDYLTAIIGFRKSIFSHI
jgi:hypothetical protein